MKKIFKMILGIMIITICAVVIIMIIHNKNSNNKQNVIETTIKIVVYDSNNNCIYEENKTTSKKYLIDVLKKISNLNIKTKTGDYGEYIISINELNEVDNYYWNYYVNNEYALVGVSEYEIKNEDTIMFKLEKF